MSGTRTTRDASLFQNAHRKLVEGTEVLRTGGGTTLAAGECNALIDRLVDLERALEQAASWIAVLPQGRPDEQATCAYVPRHVHDSIEGPLL